MDYKSFLCKKKHSGSEFGFDPIFIPDYLFDFQKALVEWAVRKGRGAIFADCGLGKTVIQLVWAENIIQKTNGKVLIITPLSVGHQTIKESEKFGIEAYKSKDGKVFKGITVTNYERLHLFNSEDFIAVVCDECFVGDTLVNTLWGNKRIEDIKVGEYIFNAFGIDRVVAKKKRYANQFLVLTIIQNQYIISSENHLFFTKRGWVKAKDLIGGDYVVYTSEAMCIMREGFNKETGIQREEILRNILLSEVENESARNQSKSSYEGSSYENRKKEESLVSSWEFKSKKGIGENTIIKSYAEGRSKRKSFKKIKRNKAPASDSGGKWKRNSLSSEEIMGKIGEEMDIGISCKFGQKTERISNKLQIGFSQIGYEDRDRGRWMESFFFNQERSGQKEGREVEGTRVDSVTIYQSDDSIFDRFRDKTGRVVLYDLQLKKHPSFSVNGLLVHNSSILKNFDGVRRKIITEFMKKKAYRLLCTATAAPNDYIELGTSSEALGELGYMDMLSRFFKNDQNTCSTRRSWVTTGGGAPKWRFKKHAEKPFWRWVCSWARVLRKPSDMGFEDRDFILPPLIERESIIPYSRPLSGRLIALPVVGLREQREERRATLVKRCEKVAEKVDDKRAAVVWCHLNDEGDLLEKLILDGKQVKGGDSDDKKEEKFIAFSEGRLRVLITKPRIGAFGLNWQHCSHVTFFPSHSYEQYYQGVRRCWRFGQKSSVIVDIITTKGELPVLKNLQRKAEAADKMFSSLNKYTGEALKMEEQNEYVKEEEIPEWL